MGGDKDRLPTTESSGGDVGSSGSGEQAQDEMQNQVGNAAVIQMLNDKNLSQGVSGLQKAAEEEMTARVNTVAATSEPGDQRGWLLQITDYIQSEGYAYWMRNGSMEPFWDITFEGIPQITDMGTDEGTFINSREMYVDLQASITFDGGTFDDWGIANYRYTGKWDVYPGVGAVPRGGGWGLVGTM